VLDAFDSFDYILGVRLQCWSGNLAHESDVVAIYLVGQIVEHPEIRHHQQLVPDFPDDPLGGASRGLAGLLGYHGRAQRQYRTSDIQGMQFHLNPPFLN
jgi:hypothetical protein